VTHTTDSRVKAALKGGESERHALYNDLRPFVANIMSAIGLFGPAIDTVSWKIFEYTLRSFDPFRGVGFETYYGFCLKRSAPRMVKIEQLKEQPEMEFATDPHGIAENIQFDTIDVDDRIALEVAIMQLPDNEQMVFLLKFAGFSFREIAQKVHMNRSMISATFKNAVALLTEMLNANRIGDEK